MVCRRRTLTVTWERIKAYQLHADDEKLDAPPMMLVPCLVACRCSDGEPDLVPCLVFCFADDYEDGRHYTAAKEYAEEHGYEVSLGGGVLSSARTTVFSRRLTSIGQTSSLPIGS